MDKELLEFYGRNKGNLTTWEVNFMEDLRKRFATDEFYSLSENQLKVLEVIKAKLLIDSDLSHKCQTCGGCGWQMPKPQYLVDEALIVRRCECVGGPENLASMLRSKGDFELADQVMAQEKDPQFREMF